MVTALRIGCGITALVLCVINPQVAFSEQPSRKSIYVYSNVSPSAPRAWISVVLKDQSTLREYRWIGDNSVFAHFLAEQRGADISSREFVLNTYVPFMEAHEGRPISVDVEAFVRSVTNFAAGEGEVWRQLNEMTATPPYTLAEVGFTTRDELLADFFEFSPLSGVGRSHPGSALEGLEGLVNPLDPRFISLLIELGLTVEDEPRFLGLVLIVREWPQTADAR